MPVFFLQPALEAGPGGPSSCKGGTYIKCICVRRLTLGASYGRENDHQGDPQALRPPRKLPDPEVLQNLQRVRPDGSKEPGLLRVEAGWCERCRRVQQIRRYARTRPAVG